MITTIFFIVIAYLSGSICSAILVCKLLNLPDPRSQGSGNPGANNVLRIGGKLAAIITLLGDALKGLIPVLLAHILGVEGLQLGFVAVAAVLGHLYPIFFRFQGGKGVATSFGVIIALSPLLTIIALMTWIIAVAIFRISSLGALITAAITPVFAIFVTNISYLIPIIILSTLTIWRHKINIKDLLAGKEDKINL